MPYLKVSSYVQAQALALANVGIPNSKIEEKTRLTSCTIQQIQNELKNKDMTLQQTISLRKNNLLRD